ncbi:DgaE family pyridoxal phosphate-dependent ammonia lyase [uncultured Deefgea sp.]|uniref:DgaE family pyridoxal phosphate-dependent ammonia lyase n=1 Tax=uncultured Deefgea sp. TaxID=1304914 RepID=UPI00260784A8|nr:DgaE family pyridoxal phosphate-dependent ammonia lyase [uncultured Deefgea sp.]
MSSIYKKYDLKPVINASGRMTILGVSTPLPEVVAAVNLGLTHYFEMQDLVDKTGAYIAGLLAVESAVVVSCASAGIAQCVAGVIIQDDADLLLNLHAKPTLVPCEIVIPKGHNVNYGAPVATMVALGGGKVVEAGWANECSSEQLAAVITPNTAAILYIKSHHTVQKSMLTVADAVAVAKTHGLPLIVDAAAEEDLRLYYQLGADLVIYSGAKAIEGPSSGLVLGREKYVAWVKKQSKGIGRAMKVGKEGILGLTCAIETFLSREQESADQMVNKMQGFMSALNAISGVSAKVVWDGAGRDIARTEIYFDHDVLGVKATEVVAALKCGEIAIYFREYKANEGKIEVDVRSVSTSQLDVISQQIRQLLQEKPQ